MRAVIERESLFESVRDGIADFRRAFAGHQRSGSVVGDNSFYDSFSRGFEKYDGSGTQHEIQVVEEAGSASAAGNDRIFKASGLAEHSLFQIAEPLLALILEYLRNGFPESLADIEVEVDELAVGSACEGASESGLSGRHESDQKNGGIVAGHKFRARVQTNIATPKAIITGTELTILYRRGSRVRKEAEKAMRASSGEAIRIKAFAFQAPLRSPCRRAWSILWEPHPGQSQPVTEWNTHLGIHFDERGSMKK